MNRGLLAGGALAVLVGLVAVADPDVLTLVPSGPSSLVVVVGVLSLVEAVRAAYSRYSGTVEEPSMPKPEQRLVSSVLESNVDIRPSVSGRRSRYVVAAENDRIRDRLTETAVAVLVRCDGDSPERARERLRTGSWTDDPAAAALFAPDAYRLPLVERVGTTITGTGVFQTQVDSAITVLTERMKRQNAHERRGPDEH